MLDGELLMDGRRDSRSAAATTWKTCWRRRIAAARAGVAAAAIAAAVRTFQAVEHRLEFVRKVGGIDFYNDSKATSVDATLKALDAFAGGLWVILGGKDKGLDYSRAARAAGGQGARRAADRRRGRERSPGQLRGAVPLVDCGDPRRGRGVRLPQRPPRATPCCWRRPAPASTSSAASSTAAKFSSRL